MLFDWLKVQKFWWWFSQFGGFITGVSSLVLPENSRTEEEKKEWEEGEKRKGGEGRELQ